MQSFQDNSRFVTMVNNRPNLSIIPPVNKRILAQKWGVQGFILFSITSVISLIGYKYFLDVSSLYVNKTKKSFSFESDPYSGKVKCNFTEVPNKQYGF
jgi:hypothetical protein